MQITEKLGSATPVVTSESSGIIGRNALTDEFKEVLWGVTAQDPNDEDDDLSPTVVSHGILLVVGFVPGLKVDAIPLLQPIRDPRVPLIDRFVMDIWEYTASVSDCTSPAGVIMFGAPAIDMKSVLDKMDYAMSMETIIVGDENSHFLHRGQGGPGNSRNPRCNSVGVALVFAHDRNKPRGIGEIEFHITSSIGLLPVGPTFKAVSVRERRKECSTWLTARREELHDILDGETLLNDITEEIGDHPVSPVLYIGVRKRRKCSVGLEKVRWVTSLAFHEVTGGDEEYLFVSDSGIKTGDSFRFYQSDLITALSSCSNVSEHLRSLRQDLDDSGSKKEVFGGIIFSCCGRGELLFGHPNVDSSPFWNNFPGVPLAGTFCCGEIGRGSSSLYRHEEAGEQNTVRCCLHAYSSFYLVMSYTPALP
ncbi:hypothetical protein U1Q18_007055 [Sarracenia purpurea var. burkii]